MFPPQEIFERFLETFDKSSAKLFKEFMTRNSNVNKWMISCDYCLHDPTRPNDCMAFSIIPFDRDFDLMKTEIKEVLKRDLKKTKNVEEETTLFLREPRFFHIVILLKKDRQLFANGPSEEPLIVARECAKQHLQAVEQHERGTESIRAAKQMVEASKAKSFNVELYGDLLLLALILSFISLVISRERKADKTGWFSDRDSMTTWCDGIVWHTATEDFYGLAEYKAIDVERDSILVALPDEDAEDPMWFEPLVRLADYLAGTLAVWDLENNLIPIKPNSDKFGQILRGAIADSTRCLVPAFDGSGRE